MSTMNSVDVIKGNKQGILDLFWKLADPDDAVRENAVVALITSLVEEQSNSEKICSELDYALNRLLGGLTSSRKAARLGFFVALVTLLKQFHHIISAKFILQKVELQSQNEDQNDVTKADLIGHCLAICSLIRSGLIEKDQTLMCKLLEELLSSCQKNKQLAQLYSRCVVDLISSVDSQHVEDMWQTVMNKFREGYKQLSPDLLWILLHFLKRLPESLKSNFIFKTSSADVELDILLNSGNLACCHPVYEELLEIALADKKLSSFWNRIMKSTLQSLKKERINFAFLAVQKTLPKLSLESQVKVVLCPEIIELVIRNLTDKSKVLHSSAVELVAFLETFVKGCPDPSLQFAVLRSLIEKPGSLFFDDHTRTRTVNGIILSLNQEAIVKSMVFLEKLFQEEKVDAKIRHRILKFACLHLRTPGPEHPQNIRNLKFLIITAHFHFAKNDQTSEIVSDNQKCAVECLNQGIGMLLKTVNRSNKNSIFNYCEVVTECLKYVVSLLDKADVIPIEGMANKKDMKKLLKTVPKFDKGCELSDVALAFKLLFVQLTFRTAFEPSKQSTLEEVYTCYENAVMSEKNISSDEASWPQVLVDVLLQILSEENALLRTVSYQSFELLLPHLPVKILDQILDVIDPKRNADILEENEENDVEDMMDVDDAVFTTAENVDVPVGDSNDSDSEVYLDDDEMFKLDDQLSKAFQVMKKTNSSTNNKDEVLLVFRNRCVDLINVVVKRLPKLSFLMPCLVTLTNVIDNGVQKKNQNALTNRSMALVNSICNIKKFTPEADIEVDFLPKVLEQVVKNVKVGSLTSNACQFIIRCALHCDKTSAEQNCTSYVDACVVVYKEWLRNFFQKKNNRYGPQLFTAVIRKHFVIGWRFADVILEFSFNRELRLFQRKHGVIMLKLLTFKQNFVFSLVSKESWQSFSTSCFSNSHEVLKELLSSEVDRSYCLEVLNLLQNVVRIDKKYMKKVEIPSGLRETLSNFKSDTSGHLLNEIKKMLTILPASENTC